MNNLRLKSLSLLPTSLLLLLGACTPRIEVMAPSEPIEINMNIKIDHEVRVKVDRELDQVISKDSELF